MGTPDNLNQTPRVDIVYQPRDKLVRRAPVTYDQDILIVKGIAMIPVRAVEHLSGKLFDAMDVFGAFRNIAETCSSNEKPTVPFVRLAIFAVNKVNLPEVFSLEPLRSDASLAHTNIARTAMCGRNVVHVGKDLALRAVRRRPIEIRSKGERVDLDIL